MNSEKTLKYIFTAAGIAISLFLLPFFFRTFAPFIPAFIVASFAQKLVHFLEHKLGISRGISSAALATLIAVSAVGVVLLIILQLLFQIKNLILALPDTVTSFQNRLTEIYSQYNGYKVSLPPEIRTLADSLINHFRERAVRLAEPLTDKAITLAKDFAIALPGMVLFFFMFILSTFFFTKDYIHIINFFNEIFPKKWIKKINKLKKPLIHGFSSYIKAQLILLLITTAIVTLSLWIARLPYPLVWGVVCGLVDALPFFGTAVILLPWALFSLLYGNISAAISLLIIQLLTFVVRQLAEPRVVSHQIGIHPILTLISVYIGLRYFGILGVLLAPIFMLLAINIYLSFRSEI